MKSIVNKDTIKNISFQQRLLKKRFPLENPFWRRDRVIPKFKGTSLNQGALPLIHLKSVVIASWSALQN